MSGPRVISAFLTLLAALALSGCAVTDTADSVKAGADTVKTGADTAQYLASVQPQLEAYVTALGPVEVSGDVGAATAAQFKKASATLQQVHLDLEGMKPAASFRAAHAKLISSSEFSVLALDLLAQSVVDKSQSDFELGRTRLTAAQADFVAAMRDVTGPLTEQLGKNG